MVPRGVLAARAAPLGPGEVSLPPAPSTAVGWGVPMLLRRAVAVRGGKEGPVEGREVLPGCPMALATGSCCCCCCCKGGGRGDGVLVDGEELVGVAEVPPPSLQFELRLPPGSCAMGGCCFGALGRGGNFGIAPTLPTAGVAAAGSLPESADDILEELRKSY
ncbi:hypothetical protein VOLCADRAFT_91936 [Volvox carteri f. nagariensis]|uniref:Uncharacterized protein n=1 Tax=Volvox carteri f. nagariensis TaxID=3068 RepID=D8TYC5_VOLCA|nr:uncharacterized protein VOLCADRAFT_91936 [Volvox carteri f. nagariensis]EFJ47618.1 hypothetical protein VOLCADRAFT_91936 [Volvox carteri f. nagariensis]|eukprot:XP_002951442.1 hypothetical protein VOLCADRAFT_91936 [Volvox carteri f. nagariensis]